MLNTQKSRDIFNSLLDVNDELSNTEVVNSQYVTNWERKQELLKELELEMGEEEFNRFINMGKAMFANK